MSMRRTGARTGTKIAAAAFLAGLLGALPAGPVYASRAGRPDDNIYAQTRHREIKIYGTVQKIPDGLIGKWNVGDKEITVTKETRIREKHGRAETGAFVEIEGSYSGEIFTAEEIEVKRSGHEQQLIR